MNRQQRRATERREQKAKVKTYNFTEAQLNAYVKKTVEEALKENNEEVMSDAVNDVMVLLLTLPLEVLIDHYWPKSCRKRIPEFTQHLLEYYRRWQDGELDMEKCKEDLWEYGGIRLEVEE